MTFNRFAVLTEQGESGVATEEFKALFALDAELHSPFLVKHLPGKKLTLHFLTEAFRNVGFPRYTHQFVDEAHHTTTLLWESQGKVHGYEVQGTMVLVYDENGLIHSATSYLRPQQVVVFLREFLFATAGANLPQAFWDASPEGFAGDPSLLKYNETADTAPKSSN
jgi:hypothetical protein